MLGGEKKLWTCEKTLPKENWMWMCLLGQACISPSCLNLGLSCRNMFLDLNSAVNICSVVLQRDSQQTGCLHRSARVIPAAPLVLPLRKGGTEREEMEARVSAQGQAMLWRRSSSWGACPTRWEVWLLCVKSVKMLGHEINECLNSMWFRDSEAVSPWTET